MKALLLVDIQNDFMPGGALPVPDGDHIIQIVQKLLKGPFDKIIASKDWHPPNHKSFAENTQGKYPGDRIILDGIDQILWPTHCVQGTKGADFCPGWDTTKIDKIIYKGIDPSIDSYSTFFDNEHLRSTELDKYLKEKGIKKVFVAGLATDYCVKYSVLDALHLGFQPYVIVDACKGINLKPNDSDQALKQMEKAGATLVYSQDLLHGTDKGRENPRPRGGPIK